MIQNDLDYYLANGSAQVIRQGDKYGYDYYANVRKANIWANGDFDLGAFKANLALETTVRGWKVALEGIYTKSINDISIRNIVAADNGSKRYAVGGSLANENNTPPYYDSSAKKSFSSIYLLENEHRGYSYNLSAMVEKNFLNHFCY